MLLSVISVILTMYSPSKLKSLSKPKEFEKLSNVDDFSTLEKVKLLLLNKQLKSKNKFDLHFLNNQKSGLDSIIAPLDLISQQGFGIFDNLFPNTGSETVLHLVVVEKSQVKTSLNKTRKLNKLLYRNFGTMVDRFTKPVSNQITCRFNLDPKRNLSANQVYFYKHDILLGPVDGKPFRVFINRKDIELRQFANGKGKREKLILKSLIVNDKFQLNLSERDYVEILFPTGTSSSSFLNHEKARFFCNSMTGNIRDGVVEFKITIKMEYDHTNPNDPIDRDVEMVDDLARDQVMVDSRDDVMVDAVDDVMVDSRDQVMVDAVDDVTPAVLNTGLFY